MSPFEVLFFGMTSLTKHMRLGMTVLGKGPFTRCLGGRVRRVQFTPQCDPGGRFLSAAPPPLYTAGGGTTVRGRGPQPLGEGCG